jgi:hypothetical protein
MQNIKNEKIVHAKYNHSKKKKKKKLIIKEKP